jgi:hypothetical protein
MVPIKIPTANVAKIVRVYAQRLALKRTQRALARESISFLLKKRKLHYTVGWPGIKHATYWLRRGKGDWGNEGRLQIADLRLQN